MNDKKLSSLVDSALSDRQIEEASNAETFFARRKAAVLKRRLLIKMIPAVAACLILAIVLGIGVMFLADKDKTPDSDKTDDFYSPGSGDTQAPNTGDWWVTPDEETPGGDDVIIDDVPEWSPWDEVKYFAVPNTSAVINVVDVDATGLVKNVQLAKGSTMIFEFAYTASAAASSFEIKFDAETVKVAFGADGKIAILKGEEQLAISAAAYTGSSNVAVEWTGAKLTVKVNGAEAVSADYTAPAALENNAELYLIAGEGAKFENAKVTLGGAAIEFETRSGTTWSIITEEGYNKDALYTGYSGASANNYKCLALINNIDFDSAKKITISADIAIGADHRTVGADGSKTGNADRGFVVEVWNTNGEGDTSPLVYENKNISFFKVFLAGYGVSASCGKYGATNFENNAQNRDGGWMTLPGGSAGLGQPAEVSTKEDGPKDEEGKKYLYQAENTFSRLDNGGADAYINFKVEWDRENYILSYYYNDTLCKSIQFTRDIFVNDGSGIGVVAASGDTYFKNIDLIVE